MFENFFELGILKYNLNVSEFSSMKTGGIVRYAFFPENESMLKDVISSVCAENIKYLIVGNGSNLLFPDGEIDAAFIFTVKMKKYHIISDDELSSFGIKASDGYSFVYAMCGMSFTALSYECARMGLSGLEFAYGIPGTVGGAVYMNAGAYGGETSDVIACVDYFDDDFNICRAFPQDCDFSYRHSVFFDNCGFTIIGAVFKLKIGDRDEILRVSRENMDKRRLKQPLEYPSCGSAFKRPHGCFAGALIESASLKGASIGGAKVSEKHAGFIINAGGATSADVLALIRYIQDVVYKVHGVRLEPEIKIVEI